MPFVRAANFQGCVGIAVMDDRIGRDVRRYQLAMRLVAHRARTQTIVDLTGISRHRLATLRRRWMVSQDERHRGPSPSSFGAFFRSPRVRSESASLAVFCRVLRAVPTNDDVRVKRSFASLDRGERLCEAFEAYRACLPVSEIEFDQVVLLASGLAKGDQIELGQCESCHGMILIDRLGRRRPCCSHCAAPRTLS
jgi:hypothetical protein